LETYSKEWKDSRRQLFSDKVVVLHKARLFVDKCVERILSVVAAHAAVAHTAKGQGFNWIFDEGKLG
jgi:hypothetical protein